MAAIRDYATTIYAAATTANMEMEMPVHVSGDLLLAFVGKDGASAFTTPSTSVGTPVSSSNWTLIQSSTSAGAGGGIYALRASSSSENVTFPLTIDTCVGTIISIRGVNGTTVADAVPNSTAYGAEDSTLPFTGVGITTSQANAMVFSHRFQDTTVGTAHLPPWVNVFVGDAAAGGSAVAYSFEPTVSTAISAPDMWAGGTDDGKAAMVEVRDGSSGDIIPPYIPLDTVPSVLISPLVGTTGVIDRGDWIAAASITITSVAGKTVTGTAIAALVDSGYNAFRGAARSIGVSSRTNLAAVELNLTATQDVTAGDLIFSTYLHTSPRDYLDTGTVANGGKYFLAGSNSTNWRAWVVGGQFSKTDSSNRRVNMLVQPSYSASQYGSAGTPNFAALDVMQFGSSGFYGLPNILWNELWELRTAVVAGGSAAEPLNFDALIFAVNNGCGFIPLLDQSGSAATMWIPLQIGGNEKIGIRVNLRTFQWPTQADPTAGFVDFHVANDKLGIEFYGTGSTDYIYFTNCVFTSDSSYYWRFNASHSASTNTSFAGSTVIKANVTLRSTVTLDGMAFISCSAFTLNSAVLTNCEFTDTKVSAASPADAGDISNTTFTKTTGTQHGIEIGGTAANVTLTGLDFTGYATSDGSTGNEAIYVNTSAGSMTISISGGTTPSIRVAAGVTVTVQNAVTVKVTVKDANTLEAIESARVLLEANSVATGTHTGSDNASVLTDASKSFATDELVDYRVYNTTDGSDGIITANTATTVTATLAGGTGNDWDTSDAYIIVAKPALNPVSITRSGTTATVAHRNHGLANGASVSIRGVTQDEYNGIYTISNVSTNAYDYTVSGTPATPATGSPTSTAVILSDVTDAFGILQTASFNFTIDQPITGKVRRATTGTLYKTGAITGTITTNGLDTTVLLIVDE